MPLVPLELGLRSNVQRDTAVGNAQLINCYAGDVGKDAKTATPIFACDGYASFSTLTGSPGGKVRGMFNLDDTTLWVAHGVSGSGRLDSVTTGGTATNRATSIIGSGQAYFARNRAATPDVVMVTSEGVTRFISGTTVTTPSLDAAVDQGLFNSVCGLDGYIIFTKSDGEFYITGIDVVTVDPLDFATAQAAGDGLVRGTVRGRDLCLFGTISCEFWQNVAATDFPFQRIHVSNFGAYAGSSVVALAGTIDGKVTDTVIWAATGPDGGYMGVLMLTGYDGTKVSTWEVDNAIKSATKANIRAGSYVAQGETFYWITDHSTFGYEYNCRTGLWHQRKAAGLSFPRKSASTVFNNLTIFGDYTSGALFQQSTAGVPASASLVSVRVSRDNGGTWTTARTKAVGTSSERKQRTKFMRFGQSKEDGFHLEIKITNAIVENSTAVDMTIIPPPVHAAPYPIQMHALHVDAIPGVSGTANPKGAIMLHADVTQVGA